MQIKSDIVFNYRTEKSVADMHHHFLVTIAIFF